jgi:hypothetical protein
MGSLLEQSLLCSLPKGKKNHHLSLVMVVVRSRVSSRDNDEVVGHDPKGSTTAVGSDTFLQARRRERYDSKLLFAQLLENALELRPSNPELPS